MPTETTNIPPWNLPADHPVNKHIDAVMLRQLLAKHGEEIQNLRQRLFDAGIP